MYLLNAAELNATISAQQPGSGRSVGAQDVSGYSSVLAAVTTRCEELLEVGSLSRQLTVDYFESNSRRNSDQILRLSGGFLTSAPADLLLTDLYDAPLSYAHVVDREKGTILLRAPSAGTYRVSYVSGFFVDDEGVYKGVPEWLKSIAKYVAQLHFRLTSMAGATPANVSYGDLLYEVRRELSARIYKRYQRPRVGVLLPYGSESTPILPADLDLEP